MIPDYIHLNESCIIDPMLLPFMNNNNNNSNNNNKDNINQTLPIPSASTTDKTTQRNSIISHYSTTTSGSTFRDSFASSDGTNEYEELQARQQWSAEQSSLGHVRSERIPSTTSSSLQPSSRYLLSGATSSETFRQQELQRFYPPSPPSLSSSPPSSSPIPKDYSSSRKVKALSDPFTTMPSIALVTQPIEMKTSSYHPHYNPSNTTATTTPTYFNDPWTMTVNLTLNDAICQDWLYKYETPTFAFSRSWKRRYVVLLDKTVYIFKSSHHSQHHYKKFYTTSSSSSFSTTTPPIPSDRFLLTEDTLVFVSQEFKKGCVIELRKPLCKWYLRCESIDQMKCWLKILKKVVACIKLNYPSPLTTKLISNLSLTDDARLLIPKSSSSSPSSSSTPYSFQQQLLQQQQQQQQLQEQLQQRSHSQRLSPLSKRLLSYSKKRNSTPPTLLQQQQQPFIALPPISFLDNNNNNTPKRQSLTQIPHWEKTLPPALPPPTSLPPPPPTTASSPSPRIMTRSFSTGSTSIKKRSNESLSPIQLPTVVETWGDSIDPSFK